MGDIKVSVVMPVYNAEKYLSDALDCVQNQTLKEIEIICVDDGSTDQSVEILNSYQEKDSRIRVLHQVEPSVGAAMARNLGLQAARGEYLSFLDADDLFELDMLECVYQKAKATNAEIVMFDGFVYDTQSEMDRYSLDYILLYGLLPGREVFDPADYADTLFQMSTGAPWNKLFKRSLIQDNKIFFQPVQVANDIVFVYLALACARQIAVLKKRLVHYRKDATGNLTSGYTKWPTAICEVFSRLKEELEDRGLLQTYETTYIKDFLAFSEYCLGEMNTLEGFRELYAELKEEYLERLGAFQISEIKLVPPHLIRMRNSIMQCDPEEYFFRMTRSAGWYSERCFALPYTWRKNGKKRVVLYGAGRCGKLIFGQLLEEASIEVVCWVDQGYERYGRLIKNPEEIRTLEYDCIFVAIESKTVFDSVKQYLISMGVERQKILWMNIRTRQ